MLRPARYVWVIGVACFALSIGIALIGVLAPGPLWLRAFSVVFVAMASLALLEVSQRRIRLTEGGIEFVSNLRRRFVPRSEIESVTWEAGCGATLTLVGGGAIELPEVGRSPQGLTNSVRAWLKRTTASSRDLVPVTA